MYKYEDIKAVHLELTERCQASCPMCPRTGNVHLNDNELSLQDVKKIFTEPFVKQLDRISLCGNFGEPIVSKDCLEIVRYFRQTNPNLIITLNTNGGARPAAWWVELGQTIGKNGFVIFGIDGLEDTNHIYRIGVRWDNMINGAKALISSGCEARWDYIVFKHNEHQIEQARNISNFLGFKQFRLKKSYRYINEHNSIIQEPQMYKNEAASNIPNNDEFFNSVSISCKVKAIDEIFITAEGLLMPCCWLAGIMYNQRLSNYKDDQIWSLIPDKKNINCKINGIQHAMESGVLDSIEQSWTKKSIEEGKLRMCAKMCNTKYDLFGSQYK